MKPTGISKLADKYGGGNEKITLGKTPIHVVMDYGQIELKVLATLLENRITEREERHEYTDTKDKR